MEKDPAEQAITRAFGEFLSGIREAQALTQEDLAELADLDRTTVSRIERGIINPRLMTINKLAVALKDHFADFFPCRAKP
ncbi:MAG: helix-turn-helix domain-containing protein [Woeseiaceae bacterium]